MKSVISLPLLFLAALAIVVEFCRRVPCASAVYVRETKEEYQAKVRGSHSAKGNRKSSSSLRRRELMMMGSMGMGMGMGAKNPLRFALYEEFFFGLVDPTYVNFLPFYENYEFGASSEGLSGRAGDVYLLATTVNWPQEDEFDNINVDKLTYLFDDGSFLILEFVGNFRATPPFYYPVTGGAGRFKGATGEAVAYPDPDTIVFVLEFEIYLPDLDSLTDFVPSEL